MALTKVPSSMLVLPLNTGESAPVASATATNLDSATGNFVHITGTTNIESFTLAEGRIMYVVFDDVLTLVNSASLILPGGAGGADVDTEAGDIAILAGEGSGITRVIGYLRASGDPVVDNQLCIAYWRGNPTTGVALNSFNISNVQRISMGIYQFTFTVPRATADYGVLGALNEDSTTTVFAYPNTQTTTTFRVNFRNGGTGAGGAGIAFLNADYDDVAVAVFHD